MSESSLNYCAALIFALALIHTFATSWFLGMAEKSKHHAGLWHLLGEVEVVFGFWAFVWVSLYALLSNFQTSLAYLDGLNFTEPLFVFVVVVIAATKPILVAVQGVVQTCARWIAKVTPLTEIHCQYFLCLALLPLLGSLITEPAAMTIAALMLRDGFYRYELSQRFRYLTLATLFVNISIGGVLTSFAAPPVLMVASTWNWDSAFMFHQFGWKAAIAVVVNALMISLYLRKELTQLASQTSEINSAATSRVPYSLVLVHFLFLAATVWFAHYPVLFLGLFLFFLGLTEAYPQFQQRLMLREALLVAFFLAGLVVLGGMQKWWLQPLLAGMQPWALFTGGAALTAVTDNAALTYLGSLVPGLSAEAKYALVAGAVTGGGLTLVANAPNPAGYALLKDSFPQQAVSPWYLFLAALGPTIYAGLCFMLL